MSQQKLAQTVRSLAVGALLSACACACGHASSARLEGHWRGVRAEGISVDSQAAGNAFAMGTELDVKGDAIAMSTPKDRQSGRYKVVKEDKTSVVIVTDRDGPDATQVFTFVDAKTMKWSVLEGKSIVFVKQ
jgi:hypothetical protein